MKIRLQTPSNATVLVLFRSTTSDPVVELTHATSQLAPSLRTRGFRLCGAQWLNSGCLMLHGRQNSSSETLVNERILGLCFNGRLNYFGWGLGIKGLCLKGVELRCGSCWGRELIELEWFLGGLRKCRESVELRRLFRR